jgi:hypothetical protein
MSVIFGRRRLPQFIAPRVQFEELAQSAVVNSLPKILLDLLRPTVSGGAFPGRGEDLQEKFK